ncbi:PREDICTED: general odorant-binding protein 2-like [Papilio xuthus]|uniref:General odorant-binding protein 2-like n=1 Tax=Papilio xuthus TaxID=66420 RepID=A0AAJ7E4V6_PAPXU|nr:PREDICTED: general odorant-binding protein 2-like [Papilio xuthus]
MDMGLLHWCLSCALAGLALTAAPAAATAEIMSHVTAHFGQTLEECREESGLTMDMMEAFAHYWSEDFGKATVQREFGCALICMSHKFSLLQDDVRLHHLNMDDYIRSFPNGELLSTKMVSMIHECERQYDSVEDDCDRIVDVSLCFRSAAQREGIAPNLAMVEAALEQYT